MKAVQAADLVPGEGESVSVAGSDLGLGEVSGRGAIPHRIAQIRLILVPNSVGGLNAAGHVDQVVTRRTVVRGKAVDSNIGDHWVDAVSQDLPDSALLCIVELYWRERSSTTLLVLGDADYQ